MVSAQSGQVFVSVLSSPAGRGVGTFATGAGNDFEAGFVGNPATNLPSSGCCFARVSAAALFALRAVFR